MIHEAVPLHLAIEICVSSCTDRGQVEALPSGAMHRNPLCLTTAAGVGVGLAVGLAKVPTPNRISQRLS